MSLICEAELFIKTLSTTLLRIVCERMLHSEVIFKSMSGPENTGNLFTYCLQLQLEEIFVVCGSQEVLQVFNDLREVREQVLLSSIG